MKKVLLLLVAVCFTALTFAQDAGALVEKANAAVEAKDYATAVELYEKVLKTPDHGQDEENINKVLGQLKPVVAKAEAKEALDAKDYPKAIELYNAAIAEFPADASIKTTASKMFYNAGITSYKAKDFIDAVKCFTIAEKQFANAKAGKNKNAALKKVATGIAAEGKTTVDEVELCDENKQLLLKSLANVYVSSGNKLYKSGSDLLIAANEKVTAGSMTTADDAYKAEVGKVKAELNKAIGVLEKAQAADATNANAKKLIDACKAQIAAL